MNDVEAMDALGFMFAGMLSFVMCAILLISLAVVAFSIACEWKCFIKMGEPGWAALVPFYNNWILCKHAWGHGAMMFTWFIPAIGTFMSLFTIWRMYKGFGKDTLFSIMGILLPIVGFAICAFDKSIFTDQKEV